MKKLYLPGDKFTLISLQLSAVSTLNGSLKVIWLPDNGMIEKTPFETHFPYIEYPKVKTLIIVHHVKIADSTVRLNGETPAIIATNETSPEYYTINDVGHVVQITDSAIAPGYFVHTLPNANGNGNDVIEPHIWGGDNQQHYLDLDCIRFIVEKNQRWEGDLTLRLDQDFFNILINFIDFKNKENEENTLPFLKPRLELEKQLDFFDMRDEISKNSSETVNMLVSQITIPSNIDMSLFISAFKNELLDAFPMKKYLTSKDMVIYHEKVVQVIPSPTGAPKLRVDVKFGILTTIYQRLQSRIVGSRSLGTLEEKVMQSLAGVFEDFGLTPEESKLYLYLNQGRHFIVNRATVKSYDIFRHVVLPINNEHNWRDKIESFIRYSNFVHNNKPINLHCVRFNLKASASLIPSAALLRLRAEVQYDTRSKVLCIADENMLYVFTSSPCVKARLKTPSGLMETSVLKTEYIKTVFADKVNINHTVEDAFTVFNLYSDVDIEHVYQEILNRHTVDEFVKPELTIC